MAKDSPLIEYELIFKPPTKSIGPYSVIWKQLDHKNIIIETFLATPDVVLNPKDGQVGVYVGTKLNHDSNNDGVLDSIKVRVQYHYNTDKDVVTNTSTAKADPVAPESGPANTALVLSNEAYKKVGDHPFVKCFPLHDVAQASSGVLTQPKIFHLFRSKSDSIFRDGKGLLLQEPINFFKALESIGRNSYKFVTEVGEDRKPLMVGACEDPWDIHIYKDRLTAGPLAGISFPSGIMTSEQIDSSKAEQSVSLVPSTDTVAIAIDFDVFRRQESRPGSVFNRKHPNSIYRHFDHYRIIPHTKCVVFSGKLDTWEDEGIHLLYRELANAEYRAFVTLPQSKYYGSRGALDIAKSNIKIHTDYPGHKVSSDKIVYSSAFAEVANPNVCFILDKSLAPDVFTQDFWRKPGLEPVFNKQDVYEDCYVLYGRVTEWTTSISNSYIALCDRLRKIDPQHKKHQLRVTVGGRDWIGDKNERNPSYNGPFKDVAVINGIISFLKQHKSESETAPMPEEISADKLKKAVEILENFASKLEAPGSGSMEVTPKASVESTAMTSIMKAFDKGRHIVGEGATRGGARKALRKSKNALIAIMKKRNVDNLVIDMVSGFLQTDAGEGILSILVGILLINAPKINESPFVVSLSDEMMKEGSAKVFEDGIELIFDMFAPLISEILSDKDIKARIEEETKSVAAQEEVETSNATANASA